MAEYKVTLPDLKETSGDDEAGETATVSFVYVDEGDTVEKDQDLIEMVTDKATFNVPSPKAGTVTSVACEEDQELSVGDLVCVLEVAE